MFYNVNYIQTDNYLYLKCTVMYWIFHPLHNKLKFTNRRPIHHTPPSTSNTTLYFKHHTPPSTLNTTLSTCHISQTTLYQPIYQPVIMSISDRYIIHHSISQPTYHIPLSHIPHDTLYHTYHSFSHTPLFISHPTHHSLSDTKHTRLYLVPDPWYKIIFL